MAQSNVYSLNVVGYVNTPLVGGGQFTAVANPLNSTNNTLLGVFSGLPSGSQVQVWNYGIQDFNVYTKTSTSFTSGGATIPFVPGQAVFVKILGAGVTNTFVGEVMQGSLTNSVAAGFNMVGSIVPQSGLATTDLGLQPPNGTQLQQWDTAIQDFHVHTKTSTSWTSGEPTLNVGEGFFLKLLAGNYDWVRNFTVQ
jgi:hypothetical protein